MHFTVFFEELTSHLNLQLPFVVYRKPEQSTVRALLQETSEEHHVNNFTEQGFVFAPFDDTSPALLFPLELSKSLETKYTKSMNRVEKVSKDSNDKTTSEKENHIQLVTKGVNEIRLGELEKVVLSRYDCVGVSEENPIQIFKSLLDTYPSAFVYCWFHPHVGLWLGATPESLLKVENNRFSTMALAGTQLYKDNLNVHWGEKEKHEQEVVTTAIVESLEGKIETLVISKSETVKAGNLLHLRTQISGTLPIMERVIDIAALVKAIHPTPAVCGFPKEAAKRFILQNENYNREFYTGYLGELNFQEIKNRNVNRRNVENRAYTSVKRVSDLYVNLRCMKVNGNQAFIFVGGGITKDSNPEAEWEETVNKTQTMKNVL